MAPLRCDHCDAVLDEHHVERDRKRFCCTDCLHAFDRGELKAISPHAHERVPAARPARQPVGVS